MCLSSDKAWENLSSGSLGYLAEWHRERGGHLKELAPGYEGVQRRDTVLTVLKLNTAIAGR